MVFHKVLRAGGVCMKQVGLYGSAAFAALVIGAFVDSMDSSAQSHRGQGVVYEAGIQARSPNVIIEAGLRASLDRGWVSNVKFADRAAMNAFYRAQEFQTYWGAEGDFDKARDVEQVVSFLKQSWRHGFDPEDYYVSRIEVLLPFTMDVLSSVDTRNASRMELDLLISDAVVRYVHDMTRMRVDGRLSGTHERYWRKPVKASAVLSRLSAGENAIEVMQSYHPKGMLYGRLQGELDNLLKDYQRVGAEDPSERIVMAFEILRYGMSDAAVPMIRERLGLFQPVRRSDRLYFDRDLEEAVSLFQGARNLDVDGVVGGDTLKLLNRSVEERIRQIVANMERMRWMSEDKPGRYIMVNIPSATLWAVDEGQVEFEMPVVVGKPSRKTRLFEAEVTGIRFNPTWTVPQSIKRKDILPQLKRDPSYLVDKGIELFRGYGTNQVTIDPFSVDWKHISDKELRDLRMVQMPGDHNALGRIRVLMPNKYNIYLHDTNHPEYFAREDRAQSSGCVRLSNPMRMARFVLGEEAWDEARVQGEIERKKLRDVRASNRLPVYIYYQTIWFGPNGKLVYGLDAYGHDKRVFKELDRMGKIKLPVGDVLKYARL